MNPTKAWRKRGELEPVPVVNREVMCQHYDDCLNVAVTKKWQDFHCARCRSYQPPQWDEHEMLADAAACVDLILAADAAADRLINTDRNYRWVTLYESGLTAKEIGQQEGRAAKTVITVLNYMGADMRPAHRRRKAVA